MASWVALTNVAVCPAPLYVTVEVDRKFVPLMVSVCAAAPALADAGERLVTLGMGAAGSAAGAGAPAHTLFPAWNQMVAATRPTIGSALGSLSLFIGDFIRMEFRISNQQPHSSKRP